MSEAASSTPETKFTNHLIHETSPYLLQHAHNPVEWFAWGEAAFAKAKAGNKPIYLSIGYSACHWCHVMEHESFEDEATAAIMNEHFVSIKVDREERPDIDQIYMNYVQMTNGNGGWPLSVFLTPDAIPFYGGTYYPPVDRYNMPSFRRVLLSVSEAYRDRQDEILTSATQILGQLRRNDLYEASALSLSTEQLNSAVTSISRSFDATNGGFGGAPKFPPSMTLEFLLKQFARTKDEKTLEMVTKTCRKMAEGGMYDQLGGGFHRYSVDAVWLVPHFEKMLYDNAQLAKLYLHVFQVTKDEFFKRIAVEILDYVVREMTDEGGGFYSAQDADSEGVEGKFFVWEQREIVETLGAEDARLFGFYYDVSEHGNFEERTILNVNQSVEKSAEMLQVSPEKLREVLEKSKKLLFDVREKRIKPFRDEKVLTAWNGLMLATFAEASAILEREDYLQIAENNADFILSKMRDANGLLLRTYKDGQAKLNAYLEDYANFSDGLIELYEATGEIKWLKSAKEIADKMLSEFWDAENGGFYFVGNSHEKLIVRSKDFLDNATPAGNSVAADVLLKLAILTGQDSYSNYAVSVFRLLSNTMRRYPSGFGRALSALDFYLNAPKEIVIIGDENKELRRVVRSNFIPNKVLVLADDANAEAAEMIPLLRERTKIDGKPTAYVCENFACQLPVTTAEGLANQLNS